VVALGPASRRRPPVGVYWLLSHGLYSVGRLLPDAAGRIYHTYSKDTKNSGEVLTTGSTWEEVLQRTADPVE